MAQATDTGSTATPYYPEIDGLRAVAVLAVVLYHAGGVPAAGFVGVDIFFVISGFLISSLLLHEYRTVGRIDLVAFYARRARRILPAALVVVLATAAACAMLLPAAALARFADSAAAAALFVANLYFSLSTGGYFDASSDEMPLLHLWSLAVEEQFYVVWPLLVIATLQRRASALLPILAALSIASFVFAEASVGTQPNVAFYQTAARFWELAAGGIVAALPIRRPAPSFVAPVALAGVLAACIFPPWRFPGSGALPAVAGTAVLLWALRSGAHLGIAGSVLRAGPMTAVGRISYSLYLWHWPLLAIDRAVTVGEPQPVVRAVLCVVAFILAAASYRWVEQPFRRLRVPSLRTVAAGVAAALVVSVAAYGWAVRLQHGSMIAAVDDPLAAAAERDLPPDWKRCHYSVYATDFPRLGCESVPGKPASIVMWGDSMAMSWKPFAWRLAQATTVSAVDYSRDACAPLLGYLPEAQMPADVKCRDFNEQVAARVKGAKLVILVMRMGTTDDKIALLEKTLAAVSPHVERVLVIGPTPEMYDAVPKCLRSNTPDRCAVARADFDSIATPKLLSLRAMAPKFGNVEVLDVSPFFCGSSTCPPVKDGVALYWDSHHVSASAAVAVANRYLAHGEILDTASPPSRSGARFGAD